MPATTDPPAAGASIPTPSVSPAAGHKSSRWSDLRLRVLSAAVLAPLALACIWAGGAAFAGLLALITIGLAYEWLGLCAQRSATPAMLLFAALPLSVVLAASGATPAALIVLALATAATAVFTRGLSAVKPLAFGIPYIGLAAVALVWLRRQPATGGANVIVLLLVVWASDIGAYIVGRAVGGPRLAPRISPGKTWSGAVGGLFAAAGVGLVASAIIGHGSVSLRSAALATLIGAVSQSGDLFESQLKRHFGVKDSGSMIPGHGGLLDRLDAVLTAAPVAALLVLVLGRGVVLWE